MAADGMRLAGSFLTHDGWFLAVCVDELFGWNSFAVCWDADQQTRGLKETGVQPAVTPAHPLLGDLLSKQELRACSPVALMTYASCWPCSQVSTHEPSSHGEWGASLSE